MTDIHKATGEWTEDERGSLAYPGVPPITTPGAEARPVPTPPRGLQTTEWGRRLRTHFGEPFFRNAYALILNTGLNGLLGAVFWLLAARNYDDADVGRASAALSAMVLLSGLVAVNATGTLTRFIPQTGRGTGRLVLYAYALGSAAAIALTACFLVTLGSWGPTFDILRTPTNALMFAVAVVSAGLFTMQDSVLTGLRSSIWVPLENALFGIAKIILLVLLATSFPRNGVYLSWVIPMAALLVPINALIFGRLIPRHVRTTRDSFAPPTTLQISRFFAADYVGALFVFGASFLVPVLVAASVRPHIFAYFYVAWTVGGLLHEIAVSLATPLTVEGVHEAERLAANCRAALARALGILLVTGLIVALAAPYGLALLGGGYLDAASLLQILAFAALPRAVVEIWIGVLRAQSLRRQIARVQIASGTLLVGSVLVWLELVPEGASLGVDRITGVGLAVFGSQTLVALAVAPQLRRFLARTPPTETAHELASPTAVIETMSPSETALTQQDEGDAGSRSRAATLIFRLPHVATHSWMPLTGVWVLSAAALVLYLLPLHNVDFDRLNGYGLISVIPPASLLGLALLTLAFIITLSFQQQRPIVLGALLLAMVGCLHGVTALVESLPRFPISWVHLGFVDYISRTGTTLPTLDGRFSWPGFFALAAFCVGKSSWQDLIPLLKLTPLISNVLFLPPLALLLRNLRATWQAKWFAAWLFCVLNWIGQDYFSPQGFSYWLYLIFLAVLVTWFRPTETSTATRSNDVPGSAFELWWRSLPMVRESGELPPQPAGTGIKIALLLLLVGLFIAATVSHQLTPFLMLAACTGLVLIRRCTLRGLPILLSVILLAWISYMTVTYWSGHLEAMLSGVGDVSGNVSTSVAARAGGDTQHTMVVYLRVTVATALFIVAGCGWLRRRRDGIDDRIALALLLTPFSTVALQSYGGEIALRVYLFALPAACLFTAYLIFPDTQTRQRAPLRFVAAGTCALVLMSSFFFTRYGNEAYEIIRAGDVAATEHVYHHNGRGQVLFLSEPPDSSALFIPIGYRDIERVGYVGVQAPFNPDEITGVIDRLRVLGRGAYLLTTRSQEAYLELVRGYPPDWGDRLRKRLASAPELRVEQETPDAAVYALRASEGLVPTSQPAPVTGTRIGSTPWTPLGLGIVAVLLVVLTAREVWRLHLPPDEHRRLLPLTFAAVPLLAGLALVLVERLVRLS